MRKTKSTKIFKLFTYRTIQKKTEQTPPKKRYAHVYTNIKLTN